MTIIARSGNESLSLLYAFVQRPVGTKPHCVVMTWRGCSLQEGILRGYIIGSNGNTHRKLSLLQAIWLIERIASLQRRTVSWKSIRPRCSSWCSLVVGYASANSFPAVCRGRQSLVSPLSAIGYELLALFMKTLGTFQENSWHFLWKLLGLLLETLNTFVLNAGGKRPKGYW